MIIEFIGPPGAGKSELVSIAMQILCELDLKAMSPYEARISCLKRTPVGRIIDFITPQKRQERILSAVSRRLLMLYRVIFAIRNELLIRRASGLLLNRKLTLKDKRTILGYFLRDCSYYQFFKDRLSPDEMLILSEGLVHRITSLHTSAWVKPSRIEILTYIKLLPKADLLIWVKTSTHKCVERVIARGQFRRYLDKELTPYINNSVETIEIAMQEIKKQGWHSAEINNNGKLNESALILRNILTKRFSYPFEKKRSLDCTV